MATIAPTGRGAEPQVFTIVPSATAWPCLRHACAVRSTSILTLSMRKCYRNATPLPAGCIGNGNAGAVAGGDLAHYCKAEARAGARRARHAVEALEDALALGGGNAGTVVLHLEEGMSAVAP